MKNKQLLLIFFSIVLSVAGQKGDKLPRFFDDPIVVDSSSTLMIPTRYNLWASGKFAAGENYFANIIFYDFATDSSKQLFSEDTYIKGFTNEYNFHYRTERNNKPENMSSKWIFYFVKPTDFNRNGKIDNSDPSILYVSDRYGNSLKSITPSNENALSINLFDKQGFALIKMQRDFDKDRDFDSDDKDFYYIRLDLNTLQLVGKIEI
jgi:hypothetical protein